MQSVGSGLDRAAWDAGPRGHQGPQVVQGLVVVAAGRLGSEPRGQLQSSGVVEGPTLPNPSSCCPGENVGTLDLPASEDKAEMRF